MQMLIRISFDVAEQALLVECLAHKTAHGPTITAVGLSEHLSQIGGHGHEWVMPPEFIA